MSKRYESLDGLRGIMAMLVMLGHLGLNTPLARFGLHVNFELAVDFFFVLSGFVLSATAYFGRKEALAFLIGRIFRLWPLHAITAVSMLLITAAPMDAVFFGSILLLNNVGLPPQTFSLNFPAWSVSVELWVSLAVFILVRWADSRAITLLGLAGGCAILVFPSLRLGGAHNIFEFVNTGLLRGFCGFLTGVLAYQVAMNLLQSDMKPPRLVQWLVLAIIGTSMITWPGSIPDTRWLFFLLTPIAVVCYALREGNWLSGKVAVEFGRLSYAIYLGSMPFPVELDRFPAGVIGGSMALSSAFRTMQ